MLELWNGMTHFEVEKGRVRVRERVCVSMGVGIGSEARCVGVLKLRGQKESTRKCRMVGAVW